MTCAYIVYRVLGSRYCTRELGNSWLKRVMMVRLVKKSNHTSRRGRRERRRGAGRMRRRAVFVAIVALLAGGIPAVRSLDPWERASGDASEIVESSLSSSSSSSSLRDDGNDEDGGSATRTTDDSVLAPPAPRLYPPGTGAYAPPGEGSVRSKRRKGYENTIAAQIEKAIDAEFSDEDVANDGAQTNRGGSARGDGLGDGSAALLVNDGSDLGGGSKFESERREEGAVLERVVVVSGTGKGEAEVVVAKKGNVEKVMKDQKKDVIQVRM